MLSLASLYEGECQEMEQQSEPVSPGSWAVICLWTVVHVLFFDQNALPALIPDPQASLLMTSKPFLFHPCADSAPKW